MNRQPRYGTDRVSRAMVVLLLAVIGFAAASCLPALSVDLGDVSIGQTADVDFEGQHEILPQEPPADDLRDCSNCHRDDGGVVRGPAAPAVAHEAEGREECVFCHGPGRLAPVAEGHPIVADSVCLGCHTEIEGDSPRMGHTVFPDSQCTVCHDPGETSPENHNDRAAYLCVLCHEPAEVHPPDAPHVLAADLACSTCHGPEQANAYPSDHIDRGDELCSTCHQSQSASVPGISHSLDGRSDCLFCHGVDDEKTRGLQ